MNQKHLRKSQLSIGVVALLKPSQVAYKITPLLQSDCVKKVILFRKERFEHYHEKLVQFVLPSVFKYKLVYWTLTPFYIARILKNEQVDLLLTYRFLPHTIFTYLVSLIIKKPFIYSQIDLDVESLVSNRLTRFAVLGILGKAYYINTPGTLSKAYWQDRLPNKVNILHSTINVDVFKPLPVTPDFDLMYIGVLSEWKRVDLLIYAVYHLAKSFSDVKCAIIGDGKSRKSLEQLAIKLGLEKNITFTGHKTVSPELMNNAKIFMMSSKAEGLPCSLMEAMACGLVCISTKVGNIPDVITDGETGYFFKSFEPIEMADQLSNLLINYMAMSNVRKEARETIVSKHSFKSATSKWDSILNELTIE